MLPPELQKPLDSDALVQKWLTDAKRRSKVLEPFEAYRKFVRSYNGQLMPYYASVLQFEADGKQIALLGINSAWMCARNKNSAGEISDYGCTLVGEPQIHDALARIAKADLRLAVLHHPFDWLAAFDRNRIEARLGRECHFILRGHEHQAEVRVMSGTEGDCVTIPAGASYDRRSATDQRYTNAYNLVHLDFDAGVGMIYLRRWSDRRNEWVEDIDARPGGKFLLKSLPKDVRSSEPITPVVVAPKVETHSGATQPPEPAGPQFPIFEVPHRHNPNFTGREQTLADLRQNFSAAGMTVIPQVITGLGGIGKTQTAVEYAYQYSGEYDLVWWIRAEESATLSADVMALANRLQLPVKTSAERQVFANIVRHWLENTPRRCLLILDNAETPEDITQLLPARGNGHILITSRNPDWRALANVLPHLKPFTPDEARAFLLKRTGQANQTAADRLAALLGHLPLALAQAGAFIANLGLSIEDYTELYESKRQYLWQREMPPPDYEATVTTTWELAFQRLRDSSPAGIALLNLCIFLAPDDIPLSVFRSGEAYLPAELIATAETPLILEEAVAALYRYSLIERQGDSLSIHRLVQEVARDRMGSERATAWVEIAVNLVKHAFSYDQYDMTTWPRCARLLPQALAVIAHAERYQVALPQAAAIWQKTGEYLRKNGEYARARESIGHALSIRTKLFGEEHEVVAESLDYLGELCQEQANYSEAHQYHQRALEIRQKKLGQEHADTALSLNNLGALYRSSGQV